MERRAAAVALDGPARDAAAVSTRWGQVRRHPPLNMRSAELTRPSALI